MRLTEQFANFRWAQQSIGQARPLGVGHGAQARDAHPGEDDLAGGHGRAFVHLAVEVRYDDRDPAETEGRYGDVEEAFICADDVLEFGSPYGVCGNPSGAKVPERSRGRVSRLIARQQGD
jgi:hypothetical protein